MPKHAVAPNKSSAKTSVAPELVKPSVAPANAGEAFKALAPSASASLERNYPTLIKAATEFNSRWIAMVYANSNASLDFARQVMTVKSPVEFVELCTAHSQKQFENFTTQARQLTEFAHTLSSEATKPSTDNARPSMDTTKSGQRH